jgi:hypothetical protein
MPSHGHPWLPQLRSIYSLIQISLREARHRVGRSRGIPNSTERVHGTNTKAVRGLGGCGEGPQTSAPVGIRPVARVRGALEESLIRGPAACRPIETHGLQC